MTAATFGLAAAVAFAVGSVATKGMVDRLPGRQLIGPLYLLNAVWILPFAPVSPWAMTRDVWFLHGVSVVVMIAMALAVFRLYEFGSAAAVTTAQATSPLPAALAVAVLVPASFSWTEAIAASVVVLGVVWALADSFPTLGRAKAAGLGLIASVGAALATVLARLQTDAGAGLTEIYSIRTALAGLIFVAMVPPRDVPRRELPRLAGRSFFISAGFAFTILGVRQGSPTVVQTMVALTPLFVMAWDIVRLGRMPPPRLLLAVGLAAAGVGILAGA